MRNILKATTLESKFPLLAVEGGCIISKDADITVVYRVELPELFTVTSAEYEAIHAASPCDAQAAARLAARGEPITEASLHAAMGMAHVPDPDLLIRTGGEMRISNFLLWQAAYSELYFSDRLWPDFDEAALDEAISAYGARERRFGKTSEQIQAARSA